MQYKQCTPSLVKWYLAQTAEGFAEQDQGQQTLTAPHNRQGAAADICEIFQR
jgi:hypothetical protein